MERSKRRVLWGLLLVAGGVLFLLQNLELLTITPWIWPFFFGATGLAFLIVFLSNLHEHWWAVIPGFTLLGLMASTSMEQIAPQIADTWDGAFFLGSIGISFWVIYLVNREHWWAIIPGGVLLTLAAITGLPTIMPEAETGGAFFLGLGLTFALLSLLPTSEGRMKWPLIPAGVLLVMGLLVIASAETLLNYLWPVALILGGLYLLLRALSSRQ
jgi:hypothetical protein